MFSLESFHRTYDTDTSEVVVGERRFQLFFPKSIQDLIDPENPLHQFPLWAKSWKASWVLADAVARRAPEPQKRLIEIGAGIGLVGIVAASFGHDITLTELDPHALRFARANAIANGLPALRIESLDWNNPGLESRFDCILGSEVVYDERQFLPLMNLFRKILRPGGEILLASEVREPTMNFYRDLQASYDIEAKKKMLRSETEETRIILCRLTPKR